MIWVLLWLYLCGAIATYAHYSNEHGAFTNFMGTLFWPVVVTVAMIALVIHEV